MQRGLGAGWRGLIGLGLVLGSVSGWAQVPRITLFTPGYGTPGDFITIRIYVQDVVNATDIRGVSFNTTEVPAGQWNVTQRDPVLGWGILVQGIPAGATTGPISVRNVGGQIGSSTDQFVVYGPGPRPLDFAPKSGRTNTLVTITGERFIQGTRVFFQSASGEVEAVQQASPVQSELRAFVPTTAVTGQIRVSSSQGSNLTVDKNGPVNFVVIQDVDLGVGLVAEPVQGVVQQPLDLLLTVTNRSGFPTSGVIATNVLPSSLVFVTADSTVGGTPTFANGMVTAVIGNLPARASARIRIQTLPSVAGTFTNAAGVRGNDVDPNLTNNTAMLPLTVLENDNDVALGVVTEPAVIYEGEPMVYNVTVTNRGPLMGTGIRVVDPLPPVLTPLTVTTTHGQKQIVGNTVTVTGITLNVGELANIRITANVNTRNPFENTLTVSANELDPDLTNNQVTIQSTPQVRQADLGVTQTVSPVALKVGVPATYTVTVRNNGPAAATNVRMVDTLSPYVEFLSTSTPPPGTSVRSGQFVIADLGRLDSATTRTVLVTVIPTVGTVITNLTEVDALEEDLTPANDRSTLAGTAVIEPPELQVELAADGAVVLRWPAYPDATQLEVADDLAGTVQWDAVLGTPTREGGLKTLRLDPGARPYPDAFYRLRLP